MTNLSKLVLAVAVAGATALSAQATGITGGISFNGNVTPYTSGNTVSPDYTQASYLIFGQTYVSAGANGSFAGIAQNTSVQMYSPLQVSPTALPPSALWQVGGFSFTLTSLTKVFATVNAMELTGTGTLTDSNPADTTTGATWVATFTSSGSTFSWNSSTATSVPEAGTTLVLLGLGLTALVGFAHIRKQAIAA